MVHDRIEARGQFPDDLAATDVSDETRHAYVAAMKAEWESSEARRLDRTYNVACGVLDKLCKKIITMQPNTLVGVGVQALATAMMTEPSGYWDEPVDERDVEIEFTTRFIANVLAAAGRSLPFAEGKEA